MIHSNVRPMTLGNMRANGGMGLLQACRHDSGGPGIPAVVGIQMPAGEKGAVSVDPIFCARAANGHAAAAPSRRVMNSRCFNRIESQFGPYSRVELQDIEFAGIG
jgi:hypothetical protein